MERYILNSRLIPRPLPTAEKQGPGIHCMCMCIISTINPCDVHGRVPNHVHRISGCVQWLIHVAHFLHKIAAITNYVCHLGQQCLPYMPMSLLSKMSAKQNLASKISELLDVIVAPHDGLPQCICYTCKRRFDSLEGTRNPPIKVICTSSHYFVHNGTHTHTYTHETITTKRQRKTPFLEHNWASHSWQFWMKSTHWQVCVLEMQCRREGGPMKTFIAGLSMSKYIARSCSAQLDSSVNSRANHSTVCMGGRLLPTKSTHSLSSPCEHVYWTLTSQVINTLHMYVLGVLVRCFLWPYITS